MLEHFAVAEMLQFLVQCTVT